MNGKPQKEFKLRNKLITLGILERSVWLQIRGQKEWRERNGLRGYFRNLEERPKCPEPLGMEKRQI